MEYLSKEEYIENIRRILERIYTKKEKEISNFDIELEQIDNLYNRYLKLQDPNKRAAQQEVVDLTTDPFKIICQEPKGFTADFWILLYDLNIYLIKRCVPERIIVKGNVKRAMENSVVIPQIIKELGLESSEYYITTYWEEEYGDSDIFIMTPNFLRDNEEMLSLDMVCGEKCITEIPELEKTIRQYFEIRNFSQEQIDSLRRDFIKQVFMSKFLGNVDENNGNISIIYDNKRNVRMAPLYDFDFCCGNELRFKCERKVDGCTDIEALVKYYINEPWFKSWINDTILNLDLKKALTEQKCKNQMDYNTEFYKNFFEKQLSKVRNAIYQSTEIEKDEM